MATEGESQFGFKDKEKAEESVKLLQKEELQYQKLTIRGLIGRAKRVLTLTKSEEKLSNIKAAIEVFENWLKENDPNYGKKKEDNPDKPETVPGLGFKDEEAAKKTLEVLKGRDPDYQKLAIKGLIGSSKRVLSGTKNPDKVTAIKSGVQVLEDYLEEFDRENYIKDNNPYLKYEIVIAFPPSKDALSAEFLDTYGGDKAKGNYKHLRTLYPSEDESKSWDIVRNRELKKLKDKVSADKISLFKSDGSPSEEHLEMIHWAYSPQADKVKSLSNKRKAEEAEDDDDDEEMDDSDDSGESPAKKKKSN